MGSFEDTENLRAKTRIIRNHPIPISAGFAVICAVFGYLLFGLWGAILGGLLGGGLAWFLLVMFMLGLA
jgi:hypothetical protein